MGRYMQDAFMKGEEWQAAWMSELEFAEMARVIKMLSEELHLESAPALDELVHHGLDAALDILAVGAGNCVSDAYYRHRALWREGQNDRARHRMN